MDDHKKILDFLLYAEKLKVELRQASKSDDNKESVAEHTWRLTLMLMLVHPKLSININLEKAMKMAIIHDIVEIDARDIPVLERISSKDIGKEKAIIELNAINKVNKMLGKDGNEIYNLWEEFEEKKTNESILVNALDKIEGQIQFLSENVYKFSQDEQKLVADLIKRTEELCELDPYLVEFYKSCREVMLERTKPVK